jgi:hypothetical protein
MRLRQAIDPAEKIIADLHRQLSAADGTVALSK